MALLEKILSILVEPNQEININIHSLGDEKFKLQIIPENGVIAESASETERLLHAALSLPMTVQGTLSEIEESICTAIDEFKEPRSDWQKQVQLMNSKIEASKTSKKEIGTSGKKPVAKKQPAKTTRKRTASNTKSATKVTVQ